MRKQSKDEFEEELKVDDTNKLIEELFKNDIKEHNVNKIIGKLNQKDTKELYMAFREKDIEDLLALRGTVKKILEINKKDDKETKYIFWTVLIVTFVTFIVNIYSQKSIKEEKFKLGLFEITTKTFDESTIISFAVVLSVTFLLVCVGWLFSKFKLKFFHMDLVLIELLDYLIEIEKEKEKNKVIKITGKRLRRPVSLGRRKLKSTSNNTSAEK